MTNFLFHGLVLEMLKKSKCFKKISDYKIYFKIQNIKFTCFSCPNSLRNQLLLMKFCQTNYCFYQKSLYIISLYKQYKWLQFLFTSLLKVLKYMYLFLKKGPSYLFEKLNWKFKMNFHEIVIEKSIFEFLKSAN